MDQTVVVQLKNITKRFGEVIANEGVDLTLKKGEIHALLGENGAGKSTLMNMLSGIYSPDSGFIFVRSEKVHFSSPKSAIAKGIGMVHQHFKLVESFTAKENIIAGSGKFFTKGSHEADCVKTLCKKYGLTIDLDKKVSEMSVSEKQMLEIIKVLYRGCDILILDEPTAVLTPQEVEKLFDIVRLMKQDGKSIIIITHKLNEVMALCDVVTVLRKGTVAKTVDIKDTNTVHLTQLMVGHSEALSIERKPVHDPKSVYDILDVTVKDKEGVPLLNKVSFSLRSGEILGVAGVAGSGQKELCEALVGLKTLESGKLVFEGEEVTGLKPRTIYEKGISMSFIPEDRLGMGLVGSMGTADNLLLKEYHTQKGLFLDKKGIKAKAEAMVEKLSIKTPNINHPVKMLSGGNIQKVLLGREIDANPRVLITAYAVRGLDVGSTHQIYDLINEQKEKGVAVLFVGEDLDVLMQLCDRIMVMCDGEMTGLVEADGVTKEQLGLMMGGQHANKGI
ncbi:ABC transporter ATP-binding protein [Niameybacter massiliensis]|uniref:ABC transporter ATP-binding protein n=1 Tax=Niameybacter massiliensis TaxID=1658108 RepID=UPI0006B5FA8E|nr:ABC transporter ATP-binding protein [Niameybacter massiliensis]